MYAKALTVLALAGSTLGHMNLWWPPALQGENNPNRVGEVPDNYNYPIGCCGQPVPDTPCRGMLDLLDTDQGKPVVTWSPGQQVNFSLTANHPNGLGGTHWGGSCQVGFSVDKGKTFKVATSWEGSCPNRDGKSPSEQTFDFTVPADIPSGDRVLFSWAWVNREKEFFNNCAVVTIAGGSTTEQSVKPEVSGSSSAAPSATPAEEEEPTASTRSKVTRTQSSNNSTPTQFEGEDGTAEYTLEGCACSCPRRSWSAQCSCQDCTSPRTKRHLVERKALEVHRRHMQNAENLNVPVRRAESVSFNSRPDMLLSIDFTGASCHSQGNPVELKYPNPGPDVVPSDGQMEVGLPSGNC